VTAVDTGGTGGASGTGGAGAMLPVTGLASDALTGFGVLLVVGGCTILYAARPKPVGRRPTPRPLASGRPAPGSVAVASGRHRVEY
jgi:hypothetical protein